MHPLPTQDISKSHDSQTTQEIRNTDAGSGLHDAPCCASGIREDGSYASTMRIIDGMSGEEKENILRFQLMEARRLIREEASKS